MIWSQRFTLPGFSGVPLYNIAVFIYKELQKDDIVTRANSVAFTFFLSIFPFIIFILPLLSLTPWAVEYVEQFEQEVDGVIPASAKLYVLDIIEGIRQEGRAELQIVSFIFSAVFASSGMMTLMYGFDKSYRDSFKKRGFFQNRLIALILTVVLAAILFIATVVVVMGRTMINMLLEIFSISGVASILLIGFKWLIVVILFYSVITLIYRYGPSTFRPLKLINPGAIVATVFSMLASVGFSFFINNFDRYNEIYGSISALIVILIWIQLNAFIVLAGFELNASIIVNRDALFTREED